MSVTTAACCACKTEVKFCQEIPNNHYLPGKLLALALDVCSSLAQCAREEFREKRKTAAQHAAPEVT
jgi:hypothetical protein